MARLAIYIDGSFLFHHAQSIHTRIDYKKLKALLTGEHNLVSCCYYTALPSDSDIDDKHKNFLRVLKQDVRMKVRSVPLLRIPNMEDGSLPRYSKGEDILLVCDLIRGALNDYYDMAVLLSGDGDFVPAVKCVQEAGKQVVVAGFLKSMSQALDMEANEAIYLDDQLDDIKLKMEEN